MGYKAQTIAYTLSYLFYAISKLKGCVVLDFKTIWNNQGLSNSLNNQLEIIAEAMYKHLTSPEREVQNVTEWAKRDNCWRSAQEIKVTLTESFLKELIFKSEELNNNREARREQKLENEVSKLTKVANFGADEFKRLLVWGTSNHVFNPQDISFVKLGIAMEKGKFPTDKQCEKILKVLEKAEEEGFT